MRAIWLVLKEGSGKNDVNMASMAGDWLWDDMKPGSATEPREDIWQTLDRKKEHYTLCG